jgi:hypothetical protein
VFNFGHSYQAFNLQVRWCFEKDVRLISYSLLKKSLRVHVEFEVEGSAVDMTATNDVGAIAPLL